MDALFLKPGDTISVIAPSSKFDPPLLAKAAHLLESWQLNAQFLCPMAEEEWLCASSLAERTACLQQALSDPLSKAIWVIRGGYGCTHLLPHLQQMAKPAQAKLLMGFSDPTLLHLFVNQQWGWPSLHCASLNQTVTHKVCQESIALLKELIFGKRRPYVLDLEPLNTHRQESSAVVVGGNLALSVSTLATAWQIETRDKFLLLEEIGEAAYQIDRLLHQLLHAGLLNQIKGLIFGDFIKRDSLKPDEQIERLRQEWATRLSIPVLAGRVGHAKHNLPIPLNCPATLSFSPKPALTFHF